jgi:hypothetical protein
MATTPTTAELMAMIFQLQVHFFALKNTAPAAAAAAPAGTAPVVFTGTPQMLGTNDLINHSKNKGQPF